MGSRPNADRKDASRAGKRSNWIESRKEKANQCKRTPATAGNQKMGDGMRNRLLNISIIFQSLMNGEEGQDLVEYALLVCLVALAAISGVNHVASAVTKVFGNVSCSLA
jgi:pilus assembly protein Flp/PilA